MGEKIRLLGIAPYENMRPLMLEVAKQFGQIDLTVFVERVIAQVVHADFDEPLLLGALEYRLVQRALQQLGYDGQNVYSHGRISFW